MSAPLLMALWVSARRPASTMSERADTSGRAPWVDGRWQAAFSESSASADAAAAVPHRRAVSPRSRATAGATG